MRARRPWASPSPGAVAGPLPHATFCMWLKTSCLDPSLLPLTKTREILDLFIHLIQFVGRHIGLTSVAPLAICWFEDRFTRWLLQGLWGSAKFHKEYWTGTTWREHTDLSKSIWTYAALHTSGHQEKFRPNEPHSIIVGHHYTEVCQGPMLHHRCLIEMFR